MLPNGGKIRIMFMDEAGFGRINKPDYCWCFDNIRPRVPCHMVREYMYAFGAIDPIDGEHYFIIGEKCNTEWTNEFLKLLSEQYSNDYIVLCGDNASWHKSEGLKIPQNIKFIGIPPYTPEMNPIEQIWAWLRKEGFKNTWFKSLNAVVDKLCECIENLENDVVKSITGREWIKAMF